MTHEEKTRQKIVDRANDTKAFRYLLQIKEDPTLGSTFHGKCLDVKADASIEYIGEIPHWRLLLMAKSKQNTFYERYIIDYENWETDVDRACEALFRNIVIRGLFHMTYHQEREDWADRVELYKGSYRGGPKP